MFAIVCLAAAMLLAGSAVIKMRDPSDAARLLRGLLPPVHRPAPARLQAAVRAGAAVELVLAAAVVTVGGRTCALLLAAVYLGFEAVALAARRARRPCGCFGRAAAPVGAAHLTLNLLAAGAALGAAATGLPAADDLAGGGFAAVTGAAEAVLLAALAYLAVTALPELRAARTSPQTRSAA